jgi:hypothetical protein
VPRNENVRRVLSIFDGAEVTRVRRSDGYVWANPKRVPVDCVSCGASLFSLSAEENSEFGAPEKRCRGCEEQKFLRTYPDASSARRDMISGLRTFYGLRKRKRLKKDEVWERFESEALEAKE